MKLRGLVPNFFINIHICERFIYSHDRSAYFAVHWERGREVSFLEIFFQIFGTVHLQCNSTVRKVYLPLKTQGQNGFKWFPTFA